MVKLLTVAALFFLFAFSHALTSSDIPTNKINGRDPADAKFPGSRPKARQPTITTILLPSEKPGTDPATVAEWGVAATSKHPESDGATILANEESTEFQHSETVPLTVISFRPVNRHFPRRPFPLSFRHGHPCHHAIGPLSPRFHGGEREHREGEAVSYGNDMLVASSDDMGVDPAFRGGARQIPARWVNFRHGGPRFPFRHEEDMESERPHHHRSHHHHEHDRREEFEGTEKQPREHKHDHEHHEDGLMRRFRKFLNHF